MFPTTRRLKVSRTLRVQDGHRIAVSPEVQSSNDSFRAGDSGALSVVTENKRLTRLFSGELPTIRGLAVLVKSFERLSGRIVLDRWA